MKILGKRILIEPVNAKKTFGGLFLPDSVGQENAEGIVIAIGSQIRESLPYTKGSHVFLSMYSGMKVTIMERDRLLVSQDDICGVLIGNAFHPIGDKILLTPTESVMHGKFLINLEDVSKDATQYHGDDLREFTVHLLGTGSRKNKKEEWMPFNVKKGDKVLSPPFAGRDVDTLDGCFKLVKEKDIFAITNQN